MLYAVLLSVYFFKYFQPLFILGARNFRSRHTHTDRKPAPKNVVRRNGVDLWRRFLGHVSWALMFDFHSHRQQVASCHCVMATYEVKSCWLRRCGIETLSDCNEKLDYVDVDDCSLYVI